MPKAPTEIRSLARAHTEEAINCLVGVMRNSTNDSAKVSAADKIIERGWGKAVQPVDGDGEGGAVKIEAIIRKIVEPDSND